LGSFRSIASRSRCLLSFAAAYAVIALSAPVLAGELTLNPTSGSAGTVHVGNTGTATFNMANGSGPNQVTAAAESGTHCVEFTLTTPSSLPHTIAGNSNENWEVTFTPTIGNRGSRGPCTYTFGDADGNVDTYTRCSRQLPDRHDDDHAVE
jgi:hypothetical protein